MDSKCCEEDLSRRVVQSLFCHLRTKIKADVTLETRVKSLVGFLIEHSSEEGIFIIFAIVTNISSLKSDLLRLEWEAN